MPGLNPAQLNYKVQNGNSSVILVGDQAVAFAQTVTHTFSLGAEALRGIGSAKPQEIQQLIAQPEITLDTFALTTNGAIQVQNSQQFAALIANNQFVISVVDINGVANFTYVGCTADNFNETVAANRPLTDAIRFLAMDVLGPDGTSLLNGPNALTVTGSLGSPVNGGLGISVGTT